MNRARCENQPQLLAPLLVRGQASTQLFLHLLGAGVINAQFSERQAQRRTSPVDHEAWSNS